MDARDVATTAGKALVSASTSAAVAAATSESVKQAADLGTEAARAAVSQMGSGLSQLTAAVQAGAQWWSGQVPPALHHVFFSKKMKVGEFYVQRMGPNMIWVPPALREAIRVFKKEDDPVPYEYDCYAFPSKLPPTRDLSDAGFILTPVERRFAIYISNDDDSAEKRIYRFGSRPIAWNKDGVVLESNNEPDMDGVPKLAVMFPFNPTEPEAADKWMVEVGFKRGSGSKLARLLVAMLKLNLVSPPEITRPRPSVQTETAFDFYFDEQADAALVHSNADSIRAEAGLAQDDLRVDEPKVACLHRFGKIDVNGDVHCKKCGHFMGTFV